MSMSIFYLLIVSCTVVGFFLGARATPDSQFAHRALHAAFHIPLRIYSFLFAVFSSHSNPRTNTHYNHYNPPNLGEDMFHVPHSWVDINGQKVRDDASHPLVFAALREAIIREDGGFVHPDIGMLIPAPSGAKRGIGFVRDTYHACQTRCMPGIGPEKKTLQEVDRVDEHIPKFWNVGLEDLNTTAKIKHIVEEQQSMDEHYRQEEILIKVPLSFQMTRRMAIATLMDLLPAEVHQRSPLHELDDAALLVLLLAHERGLGKKSKFYPYIATLPLTPSCGYSPAMREEALQTIHVMGLELGLDVVGWPLEVGKASERALLISEGLMKDYGAYIQNIEGTFMLSTIQWALCQVASRATAGSDLHGALRLVPMVDMVNHDVDAGGFLELTGNERLANGALLDATEDDAGAFVVRSTRHGRRRPLKKGQEILVNYNVPSYSALDWFLSLGFVPPERAVKWQKTEGYFKEKDRTFSTTL